MNARKNEFELVARTVARLRTTVVAIVTAMVTGFGLFVATLWLVIKGGPSVGNTLGLLNAYFPGYTVTWTGAFVGFFYGALTGALLGGMVAWMYNSIAARRANGNGCGFG